MKAVIYEEYGGPEVLKISDKPIPEIRDHEILVEVKSSSATTADQKIRSLQMPFGFNLIARIIFGIRKPKKTILGTELSGIVVQVGKNVTQYKVNDAIIAHCGSKLGCYAEYKALSQYDVIAHKPLHLTFDQASVLSFGYTTAWHFLVKKANIQSGQKILIHGASGSVGTAAIQISKMLGTHVTAVCSFKSAEYVVQQGADEVIDYQKEIFQKNNKKYDVILDVTGHLNYFNSRSSLKKNGILIQVSGSLLDLLIAPFMNWMTSQKVIAGPALENHETLNQVTQLVEQKKLNPIVEHTFSMNQISEAHQYVEKGHRKGNISIQIKK